MIRRVSFLIVLGLGLALMGAGEYVNIVGSKNLTFSITDAGDTAQIVKFDTSSVNNSYAYIDSINGTAITWTSPSSATTDSMIYDSMVVYINASAESLVVTAYDSTTFFIVVSDKKGLAFTCGADTAQDTSLTQANVTSISTDSATVSLDMVRGFKHIDGRIILNASPSYAGLGGADSAIVTFYTVGPTGRFIIAVDTCASPPCTCDVMLHSNVGDTLLRRQVEFHWYINDTVSDTTLDVTFPASWDLQLK